MIAICVIAIDGEDWNQGTLKIKKKKDFMSKLRLLFCFTRKDETNKGDL
jgi:hypothetical protein